MKLFTRYQRINLFATISIFLIACAAFYFLLNYLLIDQIDDDLKIEQNEIQTFVREHHQLPESISVDDQLIKYTSVEKPYSASFYKNETIYDPADHGMEKFRILYFGISAGNNNYKVSVAKSLEDTDRLIHLILVITFSTILLILIATLLINRLVLKKLWRPFYQTLSRVKEFKLSKTVGLQFPESRIEEFAFMNDTLGSITRDAQHEYEILKTFSENASHELQTPLAVIRSKLDLLIQDEALTETQSETVQSAYHAIQKLTRLNQSLLLLAKIGNRQYDETEQISMKEKLEEKIVEFQDLWQVQHLTYTATLQETNVMMNPALADILLNNLLSNATKHNSCNGAINIELSSHKLTISNTSTNDALDESRLFTRFYKSPKNINDNGLGLSIIQQICVVSGFSIHYQFEQGKHNFIVSFS